MRTLAHVCAALCALGFGAALCAQALPNTADPKAEFSGKVLLAAQALRRDLAAAVASSRISPEDAVVQLRASSAPAGLGADAEAELAFAAIDVGQRLLVAGKPGAAELFFREAEASLGAIIPKTADQASPQKVQYLARRAFIRANYLNKAKEARADLDEGLRLAPNDKGLLRQSRLLNADKPESLLTKNTTKG